MAKDESRSVKVMESGEINGGGLGLNCVKRHICLELLNVLLTSLKFIVT